MKHHKNQIKLIQSEDKSDNFKEYEVAIVLFIILAFIFKIILVVFYRHQKKVLNVRLPEAHDRLYFGMKAINDKF